MTWSKFRTSTFTTSIERTTAKNKKGIQMGNGEEGLLDELVLLETIKNKDKLISLTLYFVVFILNSFMFLYF